MYFLCPAHRKQLALLNNTEKDQLWFEWMNKASIHIEFEQWPQAAAYSGCAFELSCLAIANDQQQGEFQQQHMTFANILLIHCFEQLNNLDKAKIYRELAQQILLKHWGKHPHDHDFAECLKILMHNKMQQHIIHHLIAFDSNRLTSAYASLFTLETVLTAKNDSGRSLQNKIADENSVYMH